MTTWIACCGGGHGGDISLETISGNVCNFNSQYAGLPLKSHKIALTATQSGSGTPSPDNVRPITGYSAINISHSDADTSNPTVYTINLGGTYYGGEYDARTGVLTVTHEIYDLGSMTWGYTASGNRFTSSTIQSVIKHPASDSTVADIMADIYQTMSLTALRSSSSDNLIAVGDSGTISIRNTTYGTDYAAFKTAMSGKYIIYELATPQTIQLPPCPIDTLVGVNNIWADTGVTSLTYIDAGESGGGDEPIKMIVSTGAQRIDLPYYSDDGIKLKFKMFLGYVNQNGVIFGDEWSAEGILLYTEGQTLELRVISNVVINIPLPAYHIADVEFDYTTGILSIDGNTYGSYTLGGHKPICLFGLTSGHPIWGALSDISIEQNGTEVMKLVAKKDAQTGAGYYHDAIGGQDYYSTTGTDLLYTEL